MGIERRLNGDWGVEVVDEHETAKGVKGGMQQREGKRTKPILLLNDSTALDTCVIGWNSQLPNAEMLTGPGFIA